MQEQLGLSSTARISTDEPQEELLLSPEQKNPVEEPLKAEITHSHFLPTFQHHGLQDLKNATQSLDDSMLLSGLLAQDLKISHKEVQKDSSELPSHQEPIEECITALPLVNQISENSQKQLKLPDFDEKMSEKKDLFMFEEKVSKGDLSQFQTINQSDIIKSSQIISSIEYQKTTQYEEEKGSQQNYTTVNFLPEPIETTSIGRPQSPEKHFETSHLDVGNSVSKNSQEKVVRSQQKLMDLLKCFSSSILQQINQESRPQTPPKLENGVLQQLEEESLPAPRESSMIVNCSEEKSRVQSLIAEEKSESGGNRTIQKVIQANEPMQIEYDGRNYDILSMKNQDQEHNGRNVIPMEIQVNPHEVQNQTYKHHQNSGAKRFHDIKDTFNPEFTNRDEYEKMELNQSLPQNQALSQLGHEIANESRHFSLQVNFNEDSVPFNPELSIQSEKTIHIHQKTQTFQREVQQRQQTEKQVSSLVRQEEPSYHDISQPEVYTKMNDHDDRDINRENLKQSDNEQSSDYSQMPHFPLKSEPELQLHIKSENIEKSYQGIIQVINLEQQSEFNGSQKNTQEGAKESKLKSQHLKPKNLQDSFDEESSVSISRHSLDPRTEDHLDECENLLLENQANQHPESQQGAPFEPINIVSQSPEIRSQIANIINQINPNLQKKPQKQDSLKKTFTSVPQLPPCITININRHHEISLNIFNNNPVPEERFDRTMTPIKVNKSVQNQYTSTDENQTFLEQTQRKDKKRVSCKKEMKTNPNSSIDLQREPEENEPRVQVVQGEAQTQPVVFMNEEDKNTSETLPEEKIEEQYFKICNFADKYLLQQHLDEADHQEFQNLLKGHLSHRLSTEPISPIGDLLFKNGLFLVSIVKLFARESKTPFLCHYLFEHFSSSFTVEQNQYIFQDTARKARQIYVDYMDQQYQKIYTQKRQILHRDSSEEEVPVRRSSIKYIPEAVEQLVEKPKEVKSNNNLSLSSNFYCLSQRVCAPPPPQKQKHKENPQKQIETSVPFQPLQSKDKITVQNVILETSQKSSSQSLSSLQFKLGRIKPKQKEVIQEDKEKTISESKDSSKQSVKESLKKKTMVKIEEPSSHDAMKSSMVENSNQENQSRLISSSDFNNSNAQRYTKLFQKYKKIRDEVRVSTNRKQEPQGILKTGSSDSKQKGDPELKKKKIVQFVEDPVESKQGSNQEEEQLAKPKKRRRTKSKTDSSNQDGEVVMRHRTASRK